MRERRSHLTLFGLTVAALIGVAFIAVPGSPFHRGATLGLECTDHHKIVYDPTTGQEITCLERFSPSYGWFRQAAPCTAGSTYEALRVRDNGPGHPREHLTAI